MSLYNTELHNYSGMARGKKEEKKIELAIWTKIRGWINAYCTEVAIYAGL